MKAANSSFITAVRGRGVVRGAASTGRTTAGLPAFPLELNPTRRAGFDAVSTIKERRVSPLMLFSGYSFPPPDVHTQQPQSCWRAWQLQERNYSKEVHEHFFNPRNAGAFDLSDPDVKKKVGTAVVGKAACGDVIKLQVMVEGGTIKDARFKTFGCGSAIASSSYATEMIKGKSCEAALQLKNTDIAEYLNLPPVKVHCSLLAEDAVRNAIRDYQKRQQKEAATTTAAAVSTFASGGEAGQKEGGSGVVGEAKKSSASSSSTSGVPASSSSLS